jgi:DNA-damage-inducible protein J
MAAVDALVRARIDRATKARATAVLDDMGLSVSDAIRLLMIRVSDDRRRPFAIKAPREKTKRAIVELEAGQSKKFSSVDDLILDLNAED